MGHACVCVERAPRRRERGLQEDDYSPTQRIEEIPDHSGSRCLSTGMPKVEVDDETSVSGG